MSFVTRRALSTLIPPKVKPRASFPSETSSVQTVLTLRATRLLHPRYVLCTTRLLPNGSGRGGGEGWWEAGCRARARAPRTDRIAARARRLEGRLLETSGTRRLISTALQALGADPNGIAMKRVVNFYEKLPRGPAPEVKATGILGRYQAKHFGKNPSAKRTWPQAILEFPSSPEIR
ncbi:unnamed protein product [Discula destructiva]